jgi:ketosteroid isomerase-like protein
MPEVRSSVDLVRAGYRAWNSGDLESFIGYVHPEMVWTTSGLFPGLRATYTGHDGMREFWAEFREPWESFEISIDELAELGPESLLIKVRFHVKGREKIALERRITNHLLVRDEKLYRFKGYDDWDEALTDLGIGDPRQDATASADL